MEKKPKRNIVTRMFVTRQMLKALWDEPECVFLKHALDGSEQVASYFRSYL